MICSKAVAGFWPLQIQRRSCLLPFSMLHASVILEFTNGWRAHVKTQIGVKFSDTRSSTTWLHGHRPGSTGMEWMKGMERKKQWQWDGLATAWETAISAASRNCFSLLKWGLLPFTIVSENWNCELTWQVSETTAERVIAKRIGFLHWDNPPDSRVISSQHSPNHPVEMYCSES